LITYPAQGMQPSMTPYNQLSKSGRLRRLRRLAHAALDQYDLDVASLSFHCFATNLLYRVTTGDGHRYVLRLATPGWRTPDGLQAEALWLEALARDTDIPAPRIVRSLTGEAVLPMTSDHVPDTWHATLMTWVPGRHLTHFLSPTHLQRMGALFAALHIHGKSWTPPEGFSTRVFDHFVSRGEADVLFAEGQLQAYSAPALEHLRAAYAQVQAEYAGLDADDLRVIHCDLWHGNIKLHRQVLYPFDFEDTIWGYRLHDIAMAMLDLLEDAGDDRYPELLDGFKRGYGPLLPWPDGNMEVLQLGRLLWKINYVARRERQWLPEVVRRHVPVFRHFQETGQLRFGRAGAGDDT
jgi:Ser/Thr protein kinase RdoA (MazF antagonist)